MEEFDLANPIITNDLQKYGLNTAPTGEGAQSIRNTMDEIGVTTNLFGSGAMPKITRDDPSMWGETDPNKLPSPAKLGLESTDSLKLKYDNALKDYGSMSIEDLDSKFKRLQQLEEKQKEGQMLLPQEALEREQLLQQLQAGNPAKFKWAVDLLESYNTAKNREYSASLTSQEDPNAVYTQREINQSIANRMANWGLKTLDGFDKVVGSIKNASDYLTGGDELYQTYRERERLTEDVYRANGNFSDIPLEIAQEIQISGLTGHHTQQYYDWVKDPENQEKAERYANFVETYNSFKEAKDRYFNKSFFGDHFKYGQTTWDQELADKSADILLEQASRNGSWKSWGAIGNTLNLLSNYMSASGDYIADTAAETAVAGLPGRAFAASKLVAGSLGKALGYKAVGIGLATTLVGSKIPEIVADMRSSKLGTVGSDIDDPSIYFFASAAAVADYYGDVILNKIHLPGLSFAEQANKAIQSIGLKKFASRVPEAVYNLAINKSAKEFVKTLAPEIKDPSLVKHLLGVGEDLLKEMAGEALAEGSSQYLQNVGSLLGQNGITLDPAKMSLVHGDVVSAFRNAFDNEVIKNAAIGAATAAGMRIKGVPGEIVRASLGRATYWDQIKQGTASGVDAEVNELLLGDNRLNQGGISGSNTQYSSSDDVNYALNVEDHLKHSDAYAISEEKKEVEKQGRNFRNSLLEGLNDFLDSGITAEEPENVTEAEANHAIVSSISNWLVKFAGKDTAKLTGLLRALGINDSLSDINEAGQTALTGDSSTDYLRGLLGDSDALFDYRNVAWTIFSKLTKLGRGTAERTDYSKRLLNAYKELKKDPSNKEAREKFANILAAGINQASRDVYNIQTGAEYTTQERAKARSYYSSVRSAIDDRIAEQGRVQEAVDAITAQHYLHGLRRTDGKATIEAKASETLVHLAKKRANLALQLDPRARAVLDGLSRSGNLDNFSLDVLLNNSSLLSQRLASEGLTQKEINETLAKLKEIAAIQQLEVNYTKEGLKGNNKAFSRILLVTSGKSFWSDKTLNQIANLKYHTDPAISKVSDSYLVLESSLQKLFKVTSAADAFQKMVLLDKNDPEELKLYKQGINLIKRYLVESHKELKDKEDQLSQVKAVGTDPNENIEDLENQLEAIKTQKAEIEEAINSLAIIEANPTAVSKIFAGKSRLLKNLDALDAQVKNALASEYDKVIAFDEETPISQAVAQHLEDRFKNETSLTWDDSFGLSGKNTAELKELRENLVTQYNESVGNASAQQDVLNQIRTLDECIKYLDEYISQENEEVAKGNKVRGSEEEEEDTTGKKSKEPKSSKVDVNGKKAAAGLQNLLVSSAVADLSKMFRKAWIINDSAAEEPKDILKAWLNSDAKHSLLFMAGLRTPVDVYDKGGKFVVFPGKDQGNANNKGHIVQETYDFAKNILEWFGLDNPSSEALLDKSLNYSTTLFLASLYDFVYSIDSHQKPGTIAYTDRKWGPQVCLQTIVPLSSTQVNNLYSDAPLDKDGSTSLRYPNEPTEHQDVPEDCTEYDPEVANQYKLESYLTLGTGSVTTYQYTKNKAKKPKDTSGEKKPDSKPKKTTVLQKAEIPWKDTNILVKQQVGDKTVTRFWASKVADLGKKTGEWLLRKAAIIFLDKKAKFSFPGDITLNIENFNISPAVNEALKKVERRSKTILDGEVNGKRFGANEVVNDILIANDLINPDEDLDSINFVLTSGFNPAKDSTNPNIFPRLIEGVKNAKAIKLCVFKYLKEALGPDGAKLSFKDALQAFQQQAIRAYPGEDYNKAVLKYILSKPNGKDLKDFIKDTGAFTNLTGISSIESLTADIQGNQLTRFMGLFTDPNIRSEGLSKLNRNSFSYENRIGTLLQNAWNYNQLIEKGFKPVAVKAYEDINKVIDNDATDNTQESYPFAVIWVKGEVSEDFKEAVSNLCESIYGDYANNIPVVDTSVLESQEAAKKKQKEADAAIQKLREKQGNQPDPVVPKSSSTVLPKSVDSWLSCFKDILQNADYKPDTKLSDQVKELPAIDYIITDFKNNYGDVKLSECSLQEIQEIEGTLVDYLSETLFKTKEDLDNFSKNLANAFDGVIKGLAIRKAELLDEASKSPYQEILNGGIKADFTLLNDLAHILGSIKEDAFDGSVSYKVADLIFMSEAWNSLEGSSLDNSYKQGEEYILSFFGTDAKSVTESGEYQNYLDILQRVQDTLNPASEDKEAAQEGLKALLTSTYTKYNPALTRFIQDLQNPDGTFSDRSLKLINKNLNVFKHYGQLYIEASTGISAKFPNFAFFEQDSSKRPIYTNVYRNLLGDLGIGFITNGTNKIGATENVYKLLEEQLLPYAEALKANPEAFKVAFGLTDQEIADFDINQLGDYIRDKTRNNVLDVLIFSLGRRVIARGITSVIRELESTVALDMVRSKSRVDEGSPIMQHLGAGKTSEQKAQIIEAFNSALNDPNISDETREKLEKLANSWGSFPTLATALGRSIVKNMLPESGNSDFGTTGLSHGMFMEGLALHLGRTFLNTIAGFENVASSTKCLTKSTISFSTEDAYEQTILKSLGIDGEITTLLPDDSTPTDLVLNDNGISTALNALADAKKSYKFVDCTSYLTGVKAASSITCDITQLSINTKHSNSVQEYAAVKAMTLSPNAIRKSVVEDTQKALNTKFGEKTVREYLEDIIDFNKKDNNSKDIKHTSIAQAYKDIKKELGENYEDFMEFCEYSFGLKDPLKTGNFNEANAVIVTNRNQIKEALYMESMADQWYMARTKMNAILKDVSHPYYSRVKIAKDKINAIEKNAWDSDNYIFFWGEWTEGRNNRYSMLGSQFNPQSDKRYARQKCFRFYALGKGEHRFGPANEATKLSHNYRVSMGTGVMSKGRLLANSICQAFGLKPEKKNPQDWTKKAAPLFIHLINFCRTYKYDGTITPEIIAKFKTDILNNKYLAGKLGKEALELEFATGLKNVLDTCLPFASIDVSDFLFDSSLDGEALFLANEEYASDSLLKKYAPFADIAFDNWIPIEADGITNGVAIAAFGNLGMWDFFKIAFGTPLNEHFFQSSEIKLKIVGCRNVLDENGSNISANAGTTASYSTTADGEPDMYQQVMYAIDFNREDSIEGDALPILGSNITGDGAPRRGSIVIGKYSVDSNHKTFYEVVHETDLDDVFKLFKNTTVLEDLKNLIKTDEEAFRNQLAHMGLAENQIDLIIPAIENTEYTSWNEFAENLNLGGIVTPSNGLDKLTQAIAIQILDRDTVKNASIPHNYGAAKRAYYRVLAGSGFSKFIDSRKKEFPKNFEGEDAKSTAVRFILQTVQDFIDYSETNNQQKLLLSNVQGLLYHQDFYGKYVEARNRSKKYLSIDTFLRENAQELAKELGISTEIEEYNNLDRVTRRVISAAFAAAYDAENAIDEGQPVQVFDLLTKQLCDACEDKLHDFFEHSLGSNLYDAANRIAIEQRQTTALIGEGIDQLANIAQKTIANLPVNNKGSNNTILINEQLKKKVLGDILTGSAVRTPIGGKDEPYSISRKPDTQGLRITGQGEETLYLSTPSIEAEALAGGVKWIHSLDGIVAAAVQTVMEGGLLNIHDAIVGFANGMFCNGNTEQNNQLMQLMFAPDGSLSANIFRAFANYYEHCLDNIRFILQKNQDIPKALAAYLGVSKKDITPEVVDYFKAIQTSLRRSLTIDLVQAMERRFIDFKGTSEANKLVENAYSKWKEAGGADIQDTEESPMKFTGLDNNVSDTTVSMANSAYNIAAYLINYPEASVVAEDTEELHSDKAKGIYGKGKQIVTHLRNKYSDNKAKEYAEGARNGDIDSLNEASGMFMAMSPEVSELQGKHQQSAALTETGLKLLMASEIRKNYPVLSVSKGETIDDYLKNIEENYKDIYDEIQNELLRDYAIYPKNASLPEGADSITWHDIHATQVTPKDSIDTLQTYINVLKHVADVHDDAVRNFRKNGVSFNNYNFMCGTEFLPQSYYEHDDGLVGSLVENIRAAQKSGNVNREGYFRTNLLNVLAPKFDEIKYFKGSLKKSDTKGLSPEAYFESIDAFEKINTLKTDLDIVNDPKTSNDTKLNSLRNLLENTDKLKVASICYSYAPDDFRDPKNTSKYHEYQGVFDALSTFKSKYNYYKLQKVLIPSGIPMARGSEDATLEAVLQQALNVAEDEYSNEETIDTTMESAVKQKNGEYIRNATHQDLQNCFDAARALDAKNGNISAEEAHLEKLLDNIMDGVAGVSIAVCNTNKKNLGKFLLTKNQKLVVIQRAKARLANSPFMLSNTEILVHELTHALMTLIPINSKEYRILERMRNDFSKFINNDLSDKGRREVIDFMARDLAKQAVQKGLNVTTAECQKQAEKILKYVTESTFTIEEFAAYAATNPTMMHTLEYLADTYPNFKPGNVKLEGSAPSELSDKGMHILRNLLNAIIDFVRSFFQKSAEDKFRKSDNFSQAVCAVFTEIAKTTEPYRVARKVAKAFSNTTAKVENIFDTQVGNVLGKVGKVVDSVVESDAAQEVYSKGFGLAPTALQRMIADEVSEVVTNTENGTGIIKQFMRKIAKVDSVRQKAIANDSKFLQDAFGKNLTSKQHRAIETIMIHSDMQCLLGNRINFNNLNDLVQNKDGLLDNEITYIEQKINKLAVIGGKDYSVYMKTQAKNLGYYLATGDHVTVLDCKNAAQIARGFGLNAVDIGHIVDNLEEYQFNQLAENLDKLASLRSLKALHETAADNQNKHSFTSNNILSTFEKVWLKEKNKNVIKGSKVTPIKNNFAGFTALINYHKNFIKESTESFSKQHAIEGKFSSRPTYMAKGYTSDITDPSYNCVIARTKEEVEHFKNQGYVVDKTYPTHERSTSLNIRMVAKYPQVNKYTTGAFTMINEHSAGMSIDYAVEDETNRPIDLNDDLDRMILVRENLLKGVSTPMDDSDADIEANFDSRGIVTNVRLITPRYIQAKKMFRINNFSRSLAASRAKTNELEVAEKTNKDTLQIVFKEQEQAHELWKLAQMGDTKAKERLERDWVEFTPESDNKDIVSDYSIMPDYLKNAVDNFAEKQGHPLYVRKTQYNLLFGFHNFSVGKFNFTEEQIQACENKIQRLFMKLSAFMFKTPGLGKTAMVTEKGLQMLTQFAKDNIIIRNLAVPTGNMVSNMITLWLSGMNPVKAVTHSIMGLKNYIDYYDYQDKISQADRKLAYLPYDAMQARALRAKRAEWKQKIADNPISEYLSKVGDTTLVEDFTPEELHSMNPIRQVFNWVAGDVGDKLIDNSNVKLIANMATAGKGSVIHRWMSTLTTASDVVSKWAMYEHLKQTKYKFGNDRAKNIELDNKALIEANEAFILYDLPTNKYIQYANDMGLFVFSKFFLRIQKVILRTFKEHPARTIAGYGFMNGMVEFLQESFNESIIPYSYILSPFKILNRFKTPVGFFQQALNVNWSTVPAYHMAELL